MAADVVQLAIDLINIESISGAEGPMADVLERYLTARGWTVQRQTVAPGRDNVFAHRGNPNPRLLFNSHIDTVPPFFPARLQDGILYGRGACDTKSLIAAQLHAAQKLLDEGIEDIGLLYVVGEEVDHCGMIAANALKLSPDYMIVGEPTESKLARLQKGIYKIRLAASGVAAHSGYPHTGESAIDKLLDVLADIRAAEWPADDMLGATTVNIGVLRGGRAANVVPDEAQADILVRVVTSAADIRARVRAIVGDRVGVAVIASNDPQHLTTLDGFDSSVVAFNTDIPYFQFEGKALLWGAGSIMDAHTSGEKIVVADLEKAVDTYAALARRCLT